MRALVFGMLAQGKTTVFRPLQSPDVTAMINACRTLGAKVDVFEDRLEILGNLRPAEDVINAGNSGQVLRFIGAVSALTSEYAVITGDASIRHLRPVKPLLDGLEQLGAVAISSRGDDHAPIIIKGPLKGGVALVDGEDSQPISGLLIASAFAPGKTELFVTNPGEKPWVALTLNWLDRLGIPYTNDNFTKYTLPGAAFIHGFETTIPSDLSSAAYPIAAAAITGSELLLFNIEIDDVQGDKEVIFQLQKMGAKMTFDRAARTLYVHPGARLKGAKIDVNNFIDGITILSVVGCFAEGTTELTGGKVARHKESDRISAIVAELKKMGAKIHEKDDGIVIEHSSLHGAHLESHADHRIGMSLAVASLGARGESTLHGTECVAKSYAPFFDHLRKLGAKVE
jgi:3-phosphoshikimate 1-carboxyvinyltransferase